MSPRARLFSLPVVLVAALSGGRSLLLAEDPLPSAERLQSSPVLRHLKPNPVPDGTAGAGTETIARMHVPEGFRVEEVVKRLVASIPLPVKSA
jgi:hypothetical protein